MTTDFAQKFLFEGLPIRGSFVRLTGAWQEVLERSRPDPSTRDLLGQALCAAALLVSNTKFRGTIGLQVQTSGALRLMNAQCSDDGRVRGIARSEGQLTPERLGEAVLAINLEPSGRGSPYQGIVSMDPAGLVPAIEAYFRQSEQLATRFWLGAGAEACHGLMLQRVPGISQDPDAWNRVTQLADTVTAAELAKLDTEGLIRGLFHGDSVRLFEAKTLSFGCRCSAQRVADVLHSLGEEEILSLIEEQGEVEVNCEYCGKRYRFDRVDAVGLFAAKPLGAGTSGVH